MVGIHLYVMVKIRNGFAPGFSATRFAAMSAAVLLRSWTNLCSCSLLRTKRVVYNCKDFDTRYEDLFVSRALSQHFSLHCSAASAVSPSSLLAARVLLRTFQSAGPAAIFKTPQ
jgi:hypothetical protein